MSGGQLFGTLPDKFFFSIINRNTSKILKKQQYFVNTIMNYYNNYKLYMHYNLVNKGVNAYSYSTRVPSQKMLIQNTLLWGKCARAQNVVCINAQP